MNIKRFFLFVTAAAALAVFILTLAACADILNPEVNGRWNPADPNYDAATDPDPPALVPVVTITQDEVTDSAVVSWTWEADIADCTFRWAVNQNGNFEFSSEEYGATTTAETTGADGTWYCWVQAKSPAGVLSAVASATAVIDTLGPDCVVRLVKPAAGYSTGKLSVASIGFSWTVDDASEVESYIVRVGNNEDLDSATVTESFVVTSGTSYTANLNAGTHGSYSGFWQVGAQGADGNVTWSTPRRIRIGRTSNDVNADGYAEILVGSPSWNAMRGRVQFLTCGGRVAPQQVNLYSESSGENTYFGQCLNFIGDFNGDGKTDFAIGDPQNGRILVYRATVSGYPSSFVQKENAGISFGSSIAGGDFNGDGYDDMAVGARGAGTNSRGRVFLYLGSAAGTLTAEYVSPLADKEWEQLGVSIDMADINNDGYCDIIAGAPGNNGSSPCGSVYIYYGGPAATPDLTCDLTLIAPGQAFNYFGYEVAADDIDGDGYADIVVGAPGDDNPNTNDGAVYIYRGAEAGSVASSPWETIDDSFAGWTAPREGYSVDCGDLTGDGCAEVLVGVPWWGGNMYSGAVYLYYGAASINWASADVVINDSIQNGYAAQCVSVAGDLDCDGKNDLVCAIPGNSVTYSNGGRIGVTWGGASVGNHSDTGYDATVISECLGGWILGSDTFRYGRTIGRR